MKKRAVVYAQGATEDDLNAERDAMIAAAERHGWEVIGTYGDLKGKERTQLQQAIALARTGAVDVILTKLMRRISRSGAEVIEICNQVHEGGAVIWFENEGYESSVIKHNDFCKTIGVYLDEITKRISEEVENYLKYLTELPDDEGEIRISVGGKELVLPMEFATKEALKSMLKSLK